MDLKRIDAIRHASRKLVRELGILQLDKRLGDLQPQHYHAIIETSQEPGISVSKLSELLVLSVSATSRLVQTLVTGAFITTQDALDKREKSLFLTDKGKEALQKIDDYSNKLVAGACNYLTEAEQNSVLLSLQKYAEALETSRTRTSGVKIHTLSTSRPLKKQIVAMVEKIQKNEFEIPITEEVNACIVRAEEEFYYNNSYNFWYAINAQGNIIGCIGLKKLDAKNGQLLKLFVQEDYRGTGVAQMLLETLLKAATKHGFTKIWLGTTEKLKASHAFYEKSGFSPVTEKTLPKGFLRYTLDSYFFVRPL